MPQPSKTSKYRRAAIRKAAEVVLKKGILPDSRTSIQKYWELWQIKVGLNITSQHEQVEFWGGVLSQVSLQSIHMDTKPNVTAIYSRVKDELMPKRQTYRDDEHNIDSIVLSYFSKKQVKFIVRVLGTVLSMVAHRCNISERDFPSWYIHVWLTWDWLLQATNRRNVNEVAKEISTKTIAKEGDKISINGVQYTHSQAIEIATEISKLIYEEIE